MNRNFEMLFSLITLATGIVVGNLAFGNIEDKATRIHLAQPMMVPGSKLVNKSSVLDSGDYELKLWTSQTLSNVVMIYNEDDNKLVGMVMGGPAERPEPIGPQILVGVTPDGQNVLEKWFFPYEREGLGFSYKGEIVSEFTQP